MRGRPRPQLIGRRGKPLATEEAGDLFAVFLTRCHVSSESPHLVRDNLSPGKKNLRCIDLGARLTLPDDLPRRHEGISSNLSAEALLLRACSRIESRTFFSTPK